MKQLQQCQLIASFAIPYLLQFELAFEFIFHQEALFKLLRYILMINERHKLIFFAIKNPKPPWIAGHEAMTWKLNWCIEAFNNGFELQNLIDAFKHSTTHSRNKKKQNRCKQDADASGNTWTESELRFGQTSTKWRIFYSLKIILKKLYRCFAGGPTLEVFSTLPKLVVVRDSSYYQLWQNLETSKRIRSVHWVKPTYSRS